MSVPSKSPDERTSWWMGCQATPEDTMRKGELTWASSQARVTTGGDNVHATSFLCPLKTSSCLNVLMSKTRTLVSLLPVATKLPFGFHCAERTEFLCRYLQSERGRRR